MCPYGYYKDEHEHMAHIYCKLKNDRFCIYAKLCMKPEVQRFIPTEYMDECYIMNEEMKKKIPSGSYYVRFIKGDYLYVELDDDTVIKVKNNLGDLVTNYVYLKKYKGNYVASLQPFKRGKKES